MSGDENGRPEGVIVPAGDAQPGSGRRPKTIEQRIELETTLSGLGLESNEVSVPIGSDGRFVLRRLLGRGSMGAVYLADDVELERRVAIKVVTRRFEGDRHVLRLRREARALAQLDHPNVVKIYDIGNELGERFIAMEYVAGKTLREWQAGRSPLQVLEAYLDAGRGLAAAHASKLVHRDFKPDNVFVAEEDGRTSVRVGDFGLVGNDVDDPASKEPATTEHRTSSNVLMGTLPYMAPEQLRREKADARSDQHQFCVALWEAVAGKRPFEPVGRALTGDTSVPPCPAKLPRWLYRVVARGLEFEPDARYRTLSELLEELEWGLRKQRLRPWIRGIGLVAGLVAASSAVYVARQPDPCAAAAVPMATIWTAQAREDVEAAFSSRDQTAGGIMARYLTQQLDQAVAEWSDSAREVCETRQRASAVERPELDRRSACLDRWVERIEDRIAWLREPDETRMSRAFELVAPLALVGESCEVPPVVIDSQVEQSLGRAELAELVRDFDGARTLAEEAVAMAEVQGTHCTVVGSDGQPRSSELSAAWLRLGHVLGESGDTKGALAALEVAHQHAHACDDEHRDAEARIYTAKLLADYLEDVDGAAAALDDAFVALRHVEEPAISLRRYDERMAAGIVAVHAGDYEGARRSAEEARAALGDPEHQPILVAKLELNVGVAFHKEGRYEEAAAAYDRATSLVAGALGEQHHEARRYAALRALNIGLAAQESGNHELMRQQFEHAVASDEPPVVAAALTAWAQGEYVAQDRGAAAMRTEQLLALLARGPALPPLVAATAEVTAGQILLELEDGRATSVLMRACDHWRRLGIPEPEAACRIALGEALRAHGREDYARRELERLRELPASATEPMALRIDELDQSLQPQPVEPGSPPANDQGPSHP